MYPESSCKAGASSRAVTVTVPGVPTENDYLNVPTPEPGMFEEPAYRDTIIQFLSENLGEYVVCEFLIGTELLQTRQGILYSVGTNYLILYEEETATYVICDIYELKFPHGGDFVYIHIEAPDECGHHNEIREKVWAIEQIDEKVVGPVLDYLRTCGEPWAALACPDHPTPIEVLTHTPDPVPFALLRSDTEIDNGPVRFTEADAAHTGLLVDPACTLMGRLVK